MEVVKTARCFGASASEYTEIPMAGMTNDCFLRMARAAQALGDQLPLPVEQGLGRPLPDLCLGALNSTGDKRKESPRPSVRVMDRQQSQIW